MDKKKASPLKPFSRAEIKDLEERCSLTVRHVREFMHYVLQYMDDDTRVWLRRQAEIEATFGINQE